MLKNRCCGKSKFRTIRRLICEEVNERARERRLSSKGKELFKKRKTTVERSFGDSKQNHGYRYTLFKGVEKISTSIASGFSLSPIRLMVLATLKSASHDPPFADTISCHP